MTPQESEIIHWLESRSYSMSHFEKRYELEKKINLSLLNFTRGEHFGVVSQAFMTHPLLTSYIDYMDGAEKKMAILWLAIENYLSHHHQMEQADKTLNQVETLLRECLIDITPESKARGMAMLPVELANSQFMKNLHSLNDINLSSLFLKYFPVPKSNIFDKTNVPAFITEQEKASTATIRAFLRRTETDTPSIEKKIRVIQRFFRSKSRHQENLERLNFYDKKIWTQSHSGNIPNTGALLQAEHFSEKLLREANCPYQPKCMDEALSHRIVDASKKVRLFSTVRHFTARSALESIFNDGLYGRQTLLEHYMAFRPASLSSSDVALGDANVVCLGAHEIDPRAKHGIELVFDADSIAKNNPCVFYKQRDFGFDPERMREVLIGELNLNFSHTDSYRRVPHHSSSFVLYHDFPFGGYAFSHVLKSLLIADNTDKMQQILTLNFFRWIDVLKNEKNNDSPMKNKIYSELRQLTDEQLEETLQRIGQTITDTMEFNFYGAYQIDFNALLRIITDGPPRYELDLLTFRKQLKSGDIEFLKEAMSRLPEIFKSYRFIDYLLSVTQCENITLELKAQRATCTLPPWMVDTEEDDPVMGLGPL